MDLSGTLDVVIGLLFIFLVFSLIVSGIYEAGARLLATRSRLLWTSLRELLDEQSPQGDARPEVGSTSDASLTDRLYAHPIISQLEEYRRTRAFERSRVSNIDPTDFGRAIVDVLVPAEASGTSTNAVRSAVEAADIPPQVKQSLLLIASDTTATLDEIRADIGQWFDARMTVASQIYKRNTRWIMVLLGFFVVFAFNVDAIGATQELYQDDAARAAIAQQATGIVETCAAKGGDEAEIAGCASEKIDAIEGEIALPVGWGSGRSNIDGWHLLGWLIAGIALAQGAPFWFDTLRRASGLRR